MGLAMAERGHLPYDSLYWYNPGQIDLNCFGFSGGGTLDYAVRFTIDTPHAYQMVEETGIYIHIGSSGPMPAPGFVNIYDGTATQPVAPLGTEKSFGPVNVDGWQVQDWFSDFIWLYPSQEIWIWVKQQHDPGQSPGACDAGPAVRGYGDMVSFDGGASWVDLADSGYDYNWNIYLTLWFDDVEEGGASSLLELTVSNPNRGQASISYFIPRPCAVSLGVYDLSGRLLVKLRDGYTDSGSYATLVSGLSPGTYIVNLVVGEESRSTRMVITR